MVDITLRCRAPKRLFGEHPLNSFKELYLWVLREFKNPSYANHLIISVAELGYYNELTRRVIEITSSSSLGYKAKELAREIGLLRPVVGGDRYSRKEERGTEFAEIVDKILS